LDIISSKAPWWGDDVSIIPIFLTQVNVSTKPVNRFDQRKFRTVCLDKAVLLKPTSEYLGLVVW